MEEATRTRETSSSTDDEIKVKVVASEEIEQKIWNVVKQVPGLNVGYGSVRLVIYIGKGNKKEAWDSAAGVAKGLVETAAIVGCFFVAPTVAPIAAGALTGVVTDSIKGVAHVIVVMIENPG
jgi:predicted oxidoreductase (fatty acid repression mutant protein)